MNQQPENSWFVRLKNRWGLKSTWQVFLILGVFAVTGSTTAWLTRPIYRYLGIDAETSFWIKILCFVFVMLPVYNLLLLLIGFLVGQFDFFWKFEKRMLGIKNQQK